MSHVKHHYALCTSMIINVMVVYYLILEILDLFVVICILFCLLGVTLLTLLLSFEAIQFHFVVFFGCFLSLVSCPLNLVSHTLYSICFFMLLFFFLLPCGVTSYSLYSCGPQT